MANSKSGESVINRAARLLSVLGDTGALAPSDLARRAGVPLSTTHRLVAELVAEGLLRRGANGAVEPSRRLWEISTRGSQQGSVVQIALPYMQEVQAQIGQHTVLALLDRTEVLYLHRLSSPRATRHVAPAAARLPAHACSSGHALLAFAPPEDRETILGSELSRLTPTTVVAPERLRGLLADIRRLGYAVARGSTIPESAGVAVPVLRPDRTAIAALGVIIPVDSPSVLRAVAALRPAAQAIAAHLARSGFDATDTALRS